MKFKSEVQLEALSNATVDTDKFLVSDGSTVKYRTGTEVLSDLGIDPVVKAGVAINKGQAVYVTTADGTNIIVGKASNLTEAESSKTLGLLNASVPLNGMANVISNGLLEGLDTSTAIIGDPVWLGEAGNLIYGLANKPYAPKHLVYIGVVTRVNLNNGEIFINVQNGFELNEIHDVDLKTVVPVNGNVLGYNGTLWVNKTIAAWLGYTPANDSNVVHKTGDETIVGVKTFNGTTNSTTSVFNLAAVTNSPSGSSVPDSIASKTNGHNGTSTSLVSCFYGTMQGNRNVGVSAENHALLLDATNSVGFRSVFKDTSTTNNFFIGKRGDTNVFRVDDYGNTFSTKLIAGTTNNNGIDTLQVSGSTRSITTLPDGITAKILTFPSDPYGLVFRSDSFGTHSIQSQREDDNADLYTLALQPLGGNIAIGISAVTTPLYGGLAPNLLVFSTTGSVLDLRGGNGTVVAGTLLGTLQFSADDDSNYTNAAIKVNANSTAGTGNSGGGYMTFWTNAGNVTGSSIVERMRLDNIGNLTLSTFNTYVKATKFLINNGYGDVSYTSYYASPVITASGTNGTVYIGAADVSNTTSLSVGGYVYASQYRIKALNVAPTSATDTGTLGEIRYNNSHMYVCVATNTWKRSALTTW